MEIELGEWDFVLVRANNNSIATAAFPGHESTKEIVNEKQFGKMSRLLKGTNELALNVAKSDFNVSRQ